METKRVEFGTRSETRVKTVGEDYATLAVAVAALNSDGGNWTLVVPRGSWNGSGVTANSNINLVVHKGSIISVNTGTVFTIKDSIEAGPYQIFSCIGTGKVVFGVLNQDILPEWWTANTVPGTTDMTTALQAAINSITTNNLFGKVKLQPTVYNLTAPITSGKGFILEGTFPSLTAMWAGRSNLNTRVSGTWLYFNHTGLGFSLVKSGNPTDHVEFGGQFKDFGVYRNQPTPDIGWSPTANDFDFYTYAIMGLEFDHVLFFNSTKGIDADWCGQLRINNVWGTIFDNGIRIERAFDVPYINNLHLWSGYFADNANVLSYMRANYIALELRNAQNIHLSNIFINNAYAGIKFVDAGYSAAPRVQGTNIDIDMCERGVWVDSSVTGNCSAHFTNFNTQGPDVSTISRGIFIEGSGVWMNFANVTLSVTALEAVKITGNDNWIKFTNMMADRWNMDGSNLDAVVNTGNDNYVLINGGYAWDNLYSTGHGVGDGVAASGVWRDFVPVIVDGASNVPTDLTIVSAKYMVNNYTVYVDLDFVIVDKGLCSGVCRVAFPFVFASGNLAIATSVGSGHERAVVNTQIQATTDFNTDFTYLLFYDASSVWINSYQIAVSYHYELFK